MMVFLMSFAVAPLGVLAALYLREYAKQGPLVRAVRIAVNNLAGVPSIVFGVFGLGFFVYLIGGSIDRLLFPEALPTPTFGTGGILWAALTLALLTVPVVIVATEEGLAAVPRVVREGSLALRRDQVRDDPAGGAAGRRAGHPDRPDPGDGARRRRGGAADDRGHGEAGADAAGRSALPVRPLRAQVHAPRLSHLRRRIPESERGRHQAAGLRDRPAIRTVERRARRATTYCSRSTQDQSMEGRNTDEHH